MLMNMLLLNMIQSNTSYGGWAEEVCGLTSSSGSFGGRWCLHSIYLLPLSVLQFFWPMLLEMAPHSQNLSCNWSH
jgi:hypothetical protein